ncbi:MAG: RecX family transcriptional regulator [Bacteroidaceae bacterium]|nr:RecX family transcriptional regulator [Bacteroidaceae bacterium]
MMNQKITPPAQALQRLAALCAKAEYCGADIQRKLARWQLDADPDADQTAKQHILDRLAKDGYIDEARYAHAFVRDKFRYNHWGQQRIARELRLRRIPQTLIDDALEEITPHDALHTLRQLVQRKRSSVTGRSPYEINQKLIRYALSRGFDMDDILRVVGQPTDDD